MENIVKDVRSNMQKALEVLQQDFATVRTGKASPALIENIMITAYGGAEHLKVMELSTIHVADSQTLVITPFDHSVISDIEKGISAAKVGLNPIIDGTIIRISLPPLTEERRRDFVKLVSQKAENAKVMMRQVRHDGMEMVKKKGDTVSEDEVIRVEKEIQRATDEFMDKIDRLKEEKERELMKV